MTGLTDANRIQQNQKNNIFKKNYLIFFVVCVGVDNIASDGQATSLTVSPGIPWVFKLDLISQRLLETLHTTDTFQIQCSMFGQTE